jgi:hypothetical protein
MSLCVINLGTRKGGYVPQMPLILHRDLRTSISPINTSALPFAFASGAALVTNPEPKMATGAEWAWKGSSAHEIA